MLLREYDAVFLTEDFGSGRVVRLPNGRNLVYDTATSSSSYAKQQLLWGTPEAEQRFESFKNRACAVIEDDPNY